MRIKGTRNVETTWGKSLAMKTNKGAKYSMKTNSFRKKELDCTTNFFATSTRTRCLIVPCDSRTSTAHTRMRFFLYRLMVLAGSKATPWRKLQTFNSFAEKVKSFQITKHSGIRLCVEFVNMVLHKWWTNSSEHGFAQLVNKVLSLALTNATNMKCNNRSDNGLVFQRRWFTQGLLDANRFVHLPVANMFAKILVEILVANRWLLVAIAKQQLLVANRWAQSLASYLGQSLRPCLCSRTSSLPFSRIDLRHSSLKSNDDATGRHKRGTRATRSTTTWTSSGTRDFV